MGCSDVLTVDWIMSYKPFCYCFICGLIKIDEPARCQSFAPSYLQKKR